MRFRANSSRSRPRCLRVKFFGRFSKHQRVCLSVSASPPSLSRCASAARLDLSLRPRPPNRGLLQCRKSALDSRLRFTRQVREAGGLSAHSRCPFCRGFLAPRSGGRAWIAAPAHSVHTVFRVETREFWRCPGRRTIGQMSLKNGADDRYRRLPEPRALRESK